MGKNEAKNGKRRGNLRDSAVLCSSGGFGVVSGCLYRHSCSRVIQSLPVLSLLSGFSILEVGNSKPGAPAFGAADMWVWNQNRLHGKGAVCLGSVVTRQTHWMSVFKRRKPTLLQPRPFSAVIFFQLVLRFRLSLILGWAWEETSIFTEQKSTAFLVQDPASKTFLCKGNLSAWGCSVLFVLITALPCSSCLTLLGGRWDSPGAGRRQPGDRNSHRKLPEAQESLSKKAQRLERYQL